MMRSINILSLIQAHETLDTSLFKNFLSCHGIKSAIKDYELDCVKSFMHALLNAYDDVSVLDNYYIGYSIPQIGKEFDLLRFGTDCIINIELKTESSLEKISRQQQRNRYYLSFLGKPLHIYTYVQKEDRLYKLMISNISISTLEVSFVELYNRLTSQDDYEPHCIDDMFDPSDYLVSPFNSTERFMSGEYFLTVQQENICNRADKILEELGARFISITGGAGTGKTLLTYHIAKNAMARGHKVLILHCAQLNKGQRILMDEYDWDIQMPRHVNNFTGYDIIIVDEAQRMYPIQFQQITDAVKSLGIKCIFSYDDLQYLSVAEKRYDIKGKIESELSCHHYRLTDKIRTNKEIAYFITQLFDKNRNIPGLKYPNVSLLYCRDYASAKKILNDLTAKGWSVPNYTPGTRSTFQYEKYCTDNTDCAHSVIGQEFDRVVSVLDACFHYGQDGKIYADNAYYSQRQMLYQIITRTRKKLCILIINNPLMMNRCIDILNR